MFSFIKTLLSKVVKNGYTSRSDIILLGRWNSINKENVKNKNIQWANYDNCFLNIKYKNNTK